MSQIITWPSQAALTQNYSYNGANRLWTAAETGGFGYTYESIYALSCDANCPCTTAIDGSSYCSGSGADLILSCAFDGSCCSGSPIRSAILGAGTGATCGSSTSYNYSTGTQNCTTTCLSSACVNVGCTAFTPANVPTISTVCVSI